MSALMNRNINVEEIETDSFIDVSFLKYQSTGQKVIFCTGIIAAIAIMAGGTFFGLNSNVLVSISFLPLIIAIAFGCNYNEDYSLISYLILIMSKPCTTYYSKPYEDLEQLHNAAERIQKENAAAEKKQQMASGGGQRKIEKKLVVVMIVFAVIVVMLFAFTKSSKTEEVHHVVWCDGSGAVERVIT
jgi:hypothetical protein